MSDVGHDDMKLEPVSRGRLTRKVQQTRISFEDICSNSLLDFLLSQTYKVGYRELNMPLEEMRIVRVKTLTGSLAIHIGDP